MFNIGMPELILIVIIALLVVGPKRLPDVAKSLGKGLAEFRKTADDVTDSLKGTLQDDEPQPSQKDRKKEGEKILIEDKLEEEAAEEQSQAHRKESQENTAGPSVSSHGQDA